MNACQSKIVLLALLAGFGEPGCAQENLKDSTGGAPPAPQEIEPGVQRIGHLNHPGLTESSGVVASRQHPGVLWTHNDGGGGRKQVLYAVERSGRTVGEFQVTGVRLHDWEDIALDDQNFLYIGDLGNNRVRRTEAFVYRIAEPNPTSKTLVQIRASWRLLYPAEVGPFDCESLFIWNGRGYVVSKVINDARAQIFSFSLDDTKRPVTLEFVAQTKIESPVTGADLSPDGKWLALVAKSGAFLYEVDGDPGRAKGKPAYQKKFKNPNIEGCTFVPDGLLATAENKDIFLFTDGPFLRKAGPPVEAPVP